MRRLHGFRMHLRLPESRGPAGSFVPVSALHVAHAIVHTAQPENEPSWPRVTSV
jgi:hypothetical protein